ncbi:MAG: hypothetical protein ACM3NW_07235 [Syntrophomonadaceae bacterium]
MGRRGWWRTKIRQTAAHLRARVRPAERASLGTWLTATELALFDSMHVADRRHGLDVVATLRSDGVDDREVLVAGLLHDAGKGPDVGLLPRVVWSLGEACGPAVIAAGRQVRPLRASLDRLRDHAELSARLAEAAGCSERTVELIRERPAPADRRYWELLRLADEAN